MKKFLLSAFALIFAMTVFADVEIGGITVSFDKDGTAYTEETQIGSTTSVSWLVGVDTWSSTGSNTLVINGTSKSFSSNGAAGSTAPTMSKITRTDGGNDISQGYPTAGAYHKFTVSADGYLYMIFKCNTSKNYIAYEGTNRIPFYFVSCDDDGMFSFDLAKQTQILSKDNNSYIANDSTIQTPTTYLTRDGLTKGTDFEDADGHEAIIRFPVKAGNSYTFLGTGTKVAVYGYVFAPAGEDVVIKYTYTNSSTKATTDYNLIEETVPSATENITEANWDWQNYNPATINYVEDIEGNTGYIDSDVDGIKMYVDASSGKLWPNNGNVQFNSGTKLRVPVVSEGDKVIVKGYAYGTEKGVEYTVGGGETIKSIDTAESTYEVTEEDANKNGYVEIVCTGGEMTYLYSVKVEYATEDGIDLDDISSDLTTEKDPTWTSEEEGDGTISVPVDSTEVEYSSEAAGNIYFSFEIPDYAGTLSIYNTDVDEYLYTTAECSSDDENKVHGSYISTSPAHYEFTGLSTGTTYYSKIYSLTATSGTICAKYEATEEGTEYNIEFVSSTDVTGGLAKLEDGVFTITIKAENLEDGNVIRLDAYSDDSDTDSQHVISMQYFTADTDNQGQYTWTAPYDIELTEGLTYTFYATPYSAEQGGNALGDPVEILKVEGIASDEDPVIYTSQDTVRTISPSVDEFITVGEEAQEFTLTFGGHHSLETVTAYVDLGEDGQDEVTATLTEDGSETENGAIVYTLTVSAETMAKVAGKTLDIVVTAEDNTGSFVMVDDSQYLRFSYNVALSEAEWTFDPADNATVYGSLNTINVTNTTTGNEEEGDEIDEDALGISPSWQGTITITNDNDEAVEGASADAEMAESSNVTCIITIDGVTEAGNYKVNIPAGYFLLGENQLYSPAVTLNYTVAALEISLKSPTKDVLESADASDIAGTEIYVTSNALDAYMTWELNSEDGNTVGSGYFEYQESDEQYYMEWPEGITMTSGTEYTFTAYVYSDDTKSVLYGSEDLFTITGAGSEETYNTTTTATLTAEDNVYTITFTDPVNIESATYQITLRGMAQSFESDAIASTDNQEYSTTWTLTLDEDTYNETANDGGALLILNVTAKDSEGLYVTDEYNDGSLHFQSIIEFAPDWSFSPADGDTVTVLSSIVVTYEDGIAPYEYGEDDITIEAVSDDAQDVSSITFTCTENKAESDEDDDDEPASSCTIVLSSDINTAGTYEITIPEGYFDLGEWGDYQSPEITLTIIVDPSYTSGIKNVTLRATGDDRFYNLSGQRVTSPRNGVYILNGKKILIK